MGKYKRNCDKCGKYYEGYGRNFCSLDCGKFGITGRPPEDENERFWSKVDKSGDCWEWIASKFSHGHGKFWLNGKNVKAHRYSFELEKGPIPDELQINHRCDNSSCVNPAHLYLGTHDDNMRDMARSNRLKGEGNPKSKISEDDVKTIRKIWEKKNPNQTRKYKQQEIADKFGISKHQVQKIVTYKQWKHI